MSHSPTEIISSEFSPEEQKQFELLDHYMELLHSGNYQSRSLLLEEHPEFLELLSCIESLDSLAITPVENRSKEQAPLREFGKYELLEEIGRGGMGVVHKAKQIDLDRTVALKLILSNQFASQEMISRFYEEARAAGRLQHPNIVGIHEVGEEQGQHYFAMDYIEGDSLAAIAANETLDAESASECMIKIAHAVHYLHEHGIIHRDLKPANILIDDAGNPFVTDFGLAKVFDSDSDQTKTGTIIGTPSYMPPEQAACRHDAIGPQSDVYSLGAILYMLITGRPPFREETPLDTLVQVLEGEPSLPGRLNAAVQRDLELICMKCLEKDPADRYASALELAHDLERFQRREAINARPSKLWQKIRRWGRREPALTSHLSALATAAIIVQCYYFATNSQGATLHLQEMGIFCIWSACSFLFQRMLHYPRWEMLGKFLWSATDIVLLTILLSMPTDKTGLLMIGYPLLIVASGMFFRVRLVWFTTLVSVVAYAILAMLYSPEQAPPHHPFIFGSVLFILGMMVAYQVYRVRVLSKFYRGRE